MMARIRRQGWQIILAVCFAVAAGLLVRVATQNSVSITEDDSTCTAEAVAAIAAGGTLHLADDCVLMLNAAAVLTGTVHIEGGILHSGGIDRVLTIAEGATVTLTDTMVLSGAVETTPRQGGGIYNAGSLTLVDSIVAANSALQGGGIYNTGELVLIDSVVARNSAREGGGIYNEGAMTITDSVIEQNSVRRDAALDYGGYGGGIVNRGLATIVDTHITANRGDHEGIGIDTSGTLIMYHNVIMDNICIGDACRATGLLRFRGYVYARYNYWGSADGPSGDGAGNGDSVVNITRDAYTPFLIEVPE